MIGCEGKTVSFIIQNRKRLLENVQAESAHLLSTQHCMSPQAQGIFHAASAVLPMSRHSCHDSTAHEQLKTVRLHAAQQILFPVVALKLCIV